MNRTALLTLRVLAIGSALTVLGCLVVNRQKQAAATASAGAGAAAGDPGASGPEAPASQSMSTWASSSKSLHAAVSAEDVSSTINYGEPIHATAMPLKGSGQEFMLGSKSAAVIRPHDVANVRVERSGQEEAARLLSRGVAFYDRGLYQDAAAEFSAVLALDPDNAVAKNSLDRCRKVTTAPVTAPASAPAAPATPRMYLPGSKSGGVMSPDDVRRFQQRASQILNPPAQQQQGPARQQ